jgi:Bacterial antitoxin of type II TA system, VapB
MASNLDIDQKLLAQAKRMGKHRTKKGAVNAALSEYVQRRKQLGIIKLFGTINYDDDYDYKALRKRR